MRRAKLTLFIAALMLIVAAGLLAVDITVGAGNELSRKPFNFNYRFTLYETIYYPDEITRAGSITAISYYNNFPDWQYSNQHVQIWMGMTDLNDLSSGWIPSSAMTMVFNGHVNFPNGENTITIYLNEPFQYTGGNLVIMSRSPWINPWNATPLNFYCQTVGTSRARDYWSDSTNPDPAAPPVSGANLTVSGQFPKTTFHFSDSQLINDLEAVSLTGSQVLERDNPYSYDVTIYNAGYDHHSYYTVELCNQDDTVLASANGTFVPSGNSVSVPVTWTPDFEGYTSIYAKVNLAIDQNQFNDKTSLLDIVIYPPADTVLVPPTALMNRIPVDFYWRTSVFQMIFTPEIASAMKLFSDRVISAVQFYNNFHTNLPGKETKIWLGTTTLSDLTAGWIPSNEMTLVYDGLVDYPVGENVISINLQTPYLYTGENLVMMVMRPFDSSLFSSSLEYFYSYDYTDFCSRIVMSDNLSFETSNLPTPGYSLINKYPKTTFVYDYENLGTLSGKVRNNQNSPIAGAIVFLNMEGAVVTTTGSGSFHFPWLAPNSYQVTISAGGYLTQTLTAIIIEGQNTYLDIILNTPSDLVMVTGRVVNSDNPDAGVSGAMIELSGGAYDIAVTDCEGYFSFSSLLTNHTYSICVRHPNFLNCNLTFTVGYQNTNLGDILLVPFVGTDPNAVTIAATALQGNFPNPFYTQTTINFEIKEPVHTSLEIYNIRGQRVTTLISEATKSGKYSLIWNGRDSGGKAVSNGIYYYKMTSGKFTATRKMILLK